MQNNPVKYLHLPVDSALPALPGLERFRAIVLVEEEVSDIWQWEVSRWLVAAGARYVQVWGAGCASWEESVEDAFLEATDYEDVPAELAVLTSAHEDEDIEEVFWYARHRAAHPGQELRDTLIVHIADADRREELEALYDKS
ncbi:hypothetical protein ACLB1G_07610 [Oxalobacteraceae bacterium A2-2]